jgi:SAM-dependent methyltransferase
MGTATVNKGIRSEVLDTFSAASGEYATARPTYPAALFNALAALAPTTECAWDCGTGSGQAAAGLAQFFDSVQATDASAEQISHAVPHPRVSYQVATAARSGLLDRSVDLISVAQALHWFELPEFYAEVRRVARPSAVLAIYGYDWFYIAPQIDQLVNRWLLQPVQAYWHPRVRLLWDRYRTIEFPFQEVAEPRLGIYLSWTLQQLIDYYRTWSATRGKIAAEGERFLIDAYEALTSVWGDPMASRSVLMPITLRLGRIP